MKLKTKLFIGICLLVCASADGQKLSKTDLVGMYSEYNFTNLEPVVYHSSEEASTVFLDVSLHHFLYVSGEEGSQVANFSVTHSIYPSYNSKTPIERQTHFFSDSLHAGEEMEMAVDFEVSAAYPGSYVLHVELTDLNEPEKSVSSFLDIDKESNYSSQNFYLSDEDGYPLFSNYFTEDSYFKILYNNPDTQQLVIRYYNRDFPIAKPPFAMDKNVTYTFEPDSFYTVLLDGGQSQLLELPYQGIYHITPGLANPEGLTLYRFDDGFPDVNIPAMALAPLRYLTTEREFEQLLSYGDYKVAVDSFWLERASFDPDRAKRMIRKFYQRVDLHHLRPAFGGVPKGWGGGVDLW
jgi:hypothetical protein